MKTNVKILSLIPLFVFLFVNTTFAQDANKDIKRSGNCFYEQLTDSQKLQVDAIKLESDKKIVEFKADLKIKKAELDKLLIAENPVKKAIDAKIDEISVIKAKIQKEKVDHRLKVREILSPEQRAKFDSMHHGKKSHKKMSSGNHPHKMQMDGKNDFKKQCR